VRQELFDQILTTAAQLFAAATAVENSLPGFGLVVHLVSIRKATMDWL
jgi:hypothetical protein